MSFQLMFAIAWLFFFNEVRAAKYPVPEAAKQRTAEKTIKDTFKSDYKKSRRPNEMNDLAQRLLQRAIDAKGDYITRFVLLREARDFAARVPNPDLVHDVIDVMEKFYEIDAVEMKADVLKKLRTRIKSTAAGYNYIQSLMRLIDQSISVGRVVTAEELSQFSITAAGRLRDPRILVELKVKRDQVKQLKDVWEEAETAKVKLKNDPEDPAANTAIGIYLCLVMNKWATGMRYLSKSGDSELNSVAFSELNSPDTPKACLALADDWWALSENADTEFRKIRFLGRSQFWYRRAVNGLSGIDRTRAADRIRSIQEFDSETKRVYLDTLEEFDVISGPWGLGKNGKKGAANFNNNPIIIHEKVASHGLGMHPPSNGFSRVRYRVNRQFGTFIATAGLSTKAGTETESPISFAVLADGKILWKSKPMYKAQQTQSCALDISDATVLEIRVLCPGSHFNAHAVLIDPYLMKARNLVKN